MTSQSVLELDGKGCSLSNHTKPPAVNYHPRLWACWVRDQDGGWESLFTKPSTVSNNLAVD